MTNFFRIALGVALISALLGCPNDARPDVDEYREQFERTRIEIARLGALVVKRDEGLEIVCSCASLPKPNKVKPKPSPPPVVDREAFKSGMAVLQKIEDASVAGRHIGFVSQN
jgi:hypothetical protein